MKFATCNAPLKVYGLSREMLQTADSITHGPQREPTTGAPVNSDRDAIVLAFGRGYGSADIVIRRKLSGFDCRIDVMVRLPDGRERLHAYNAELSVEFISFWEDLVAEIHRRSGQNVEDEKRLVAEFLATAVE
jgi:hypothetical protein